MIAAKAFDPVLGVDIHIIQPPGPVPPVPVPHPFVGMLIDPMDFAPVVGATVMVNGMPRATAGTGGKCIPPHIPIGGVFVKPPANECEVFMGSSTVLADGDPLSFLGMPALSCHDVGMVAPFRLKKKRKTKSLVLPTSVVLSVPAGAPVLVGGPPTISMMALGMKAAMAGLGKAFRKLRKLKAFKKAARSFKKAKAKAFKNMKPGFLKCKVLKAEPVNVVTGEVIVEQTDFALPWRVPLRWGRTYSSASTYLGSCGYGWECPADIRLEVDREGIVTFRDGTRFVTVFAALPAPDSVQHDAIEGSSLRRTGGAAIELRTRSGVVFHFSVVPSPDAPAYVERMTDRRRNWIEFRRDGTRLREVRESGGSVLEVTWAGSHLRSVALRPPGQGGLRPLIAYEHDQSDLVIVRDALGMPYRFAYDRGRLIRHTDRIGLSFHYEYDVAGPYGRCTHAWGDGGLYDYRFSYLERATHIRDSRGGEWSVVHDAGLVLAETDPLGATTRFEYDDSGRTTAVIDPAGSRTVYGWDDSANLVTLGRPDGVSVTTAFNEHNDPVVLTDPNGNAWTQEWSDDGLLLAQTTPRGATWTFAYDERGELAAMRDPEGHTTHYTCDRHGAVTEMVEPTGAVRRFELDDLGNVVREIDARGEATSYRYDVKGRLTEIVHPSGRTTAYGYDPADNLVSFRDENGNVTRNVVVGIGETGQRIQPDGTVVHYFYDTEENLVAIVNENGQRHVLRRDAAGRVVEEIDFWGNSLRLDYDVAGNVHAVTDALGRTTKRGHDALGRLTRKTYPDGATDEFAYDPNGNLLGATGAGISIERVCDPDNNLVREIVNGFVVENEYDLTGNRIARQSSLGNRVAWSHDGNGRVSEIRVNGEATLTINRDLNGLTVEERFGDALHRTYVLNRDGWIIEQRTSVVDLPIHVRGFEYDAMGNVLVRKDSATGAVRFGYDPMGRVAAFTSAGGKRRAFGRQLTGDVTQPVAILPGGSRVEQLGDMRFVYDAAGNMVERRGERGVCRFSWNANNWLMAARTENGTEVGFAYDPLGRRTEKASDTATNTFLWDADHLLAAVGDYGATEYVHYPGTFEVAMQINSDRSLFFFDNDPVGAPHRLLDRTGRTVWSAAYGPFGEVETRPVCDVENPIRLQGQYHDQETGLHYNRNRYYDPTTGSFISQDPLGTLTGDNLYLYAPNAWRWIDPLGLTCGDVPPWKGPCDYSSLKNSPSAGPGKKVTAAQKKKMMELNKKHNDGLLRDDTTGEVLVPSKKSKKGVTPPANEAQFDHIKPRSKGGANTYDNLQILSRKNNRDKWDT